MNSPRRDQRSPLFSLVCGYNGISRGDRRGCVRFGFPDREWLTVIFEGGVILEHASRRWIFLPSLALGVVTLVLGAGAPTDSDPGGRGDGWESAGVVTAFLVTAAALPHAGQAASHVAGVPRRRARHGGPRSSAGR